MIALRQRGFSFVHFNARIATAIQIEGRKKWRFSYRPSVPWPIHNGTINDNDMIEWQFPPTAWEQQIKPVMALKWTEVVLEQSDFLCATWPINSFGNSFCSTKAWTRARSIH
jgi:hypothetical protein